MSCVNVAVDPVGHTKPLETKALVVLDPNRKMPTEIAETRCKAYLRVPLWSTSTLISVQNNKFPMEHMYRWYNAIALRATMLTTEVLATETFGELL